MKLRIARKIYAHIGSPRESAYTERQCRLAIERVVRTKTERETRAWWQRFLASRWGDVLRRIEA